VDYPERLARTGDPLLDLLVRCDFGTIVVTVRSREMSSHSLITILLFFFVVRLLLPSREGIRVWRDAGKVGPMFMVGLGCFPLSFTLLHIMRFGLLTFVSRDLGRG
jgi:hypothetical protein